MFGRGIYLFVLGVGNTWLGFLSFLGFGMTTLCFILICIFWVISKLVGFHLKFFFKNFLKFLFGFGAGNDLTIVFSFDLGVVI